MAHTNSTTHYSLPQFITTDKPAWLTDVNNAYIAIDTGIYNAKKAGDDAQADATQALTDAGTAQTKANTADAKAGGAIASISEAFLDSATYAVGDLVMYNNLLYKCHTAVTTPGDWSGSANWSRATIDDIIKTLTANDLTNVNITSPADNQILCMSDGNIVNKNILNIIKVVDFTFDMSPNSYVSPFTTYGSVSNADFATLEGHTVISVSDVTPNTTSPVHMKYISGSGIYGYGRASSGTVRVFYI